MEVSIILNVSKRAYVYRRGPLGTYIVPPIYEATGEFGMLVVRPEGEIRDVGSGQTTRSEKIEAKLLAKDILGEMGTKMGLLICAAEPEESRAIERAEREERDYLTNNPAEIRHRFNPITKIPEFSSVDEHDVKREKIRLSKKVVEERDKFYAMCRKLVTEEEIAKAETNLTSWYQELVKEANRLWAREQTRGEVNEHHKFAAVELGLDDLPWSQTPVPRKDCPGCGEKIKLAVAMCPNCHAILDEKQARKLWPEKFAEKKSA